MSQAVVVKAAPKSRLKTECEVLQRFQGQARIRQLLDVVEAPPAIVLEYFEDNLLNASNSSTLQPREVKFVARCVLDALKVLDEHGYVHTDVKPDNILVNYDVVNNGTQSRFNKVALGDCGDCFRVDLNVDPKDMSKKDGHIIGAAIFRSPEAMLNLKWGTTTDIWSFGTTPDEVTIDDGNYPAHILIKQASHFGPFPASYVQIADDERLATLTFVNKYVKKSGKRKPFRLAQDSELSPQDRDFICKIMMLDPRDRPTAAQLLQGEWFHS